MLFLFNNITNLIKHNKIVQISILCIALISFVLSLCTSFLAGFTIVGSYFFGLVTCSLLLQYQAIAFPLIWNFTNQWKKCNKASTESNGVCNVCSGSKCRRFLKQDKTPWKSIRVKKKLNDAVEHLFNTILGEFIESWYGQFTSDLTFVSSLRNSIRYSVCLAINKVMHLDTGRIISDKLIPCAIRHIDDCLCMERIARLKNIGIEQVAISYLGSRLHIAATNRKREVDYIRQLATYILPTLMPTEYMRCENFSVFMRELLAMWTLLPFMDVLADPNIINHLVILSVNVIMQTKRPTFTRDYSIKQDSMVEILCNFDKKHSSPSPFALELKSILKDTELLYAFMQFLKKEDKVHLLQFCLDVEDFNSSLLHPDLSKVQLIAVHATATSLYQRYIDPATAVSSHIGCDRQLTLQLRQLLASGGVERIVRLRTTEPLLFAAADHVYHVLEHDWLPGFYRCAGFYKYLCKSKGLKRDKPSSHQQSQPGSNSSLYQGDRSAVSRISSGLGKIKGALAVRAPVEGAPFCNVQAIQVIESQQITGSDLSMWKVSIPTVTIRERDRDKEQEGDRYKHGHSKWLFHVDVISTCNQLQDINIDSKIGKRDMSEKRTVQWTVLRNERDFHTLKGKLSEIQSIADSLQFPLINLNSKISVDDRRNKYEIFLRHALSLQSTSPSSSYRQVLIKFLTSTMSFHDLADKEKQPLETAATTNTVDLETIYQSVALRLRKEKGQHLDTSFMAAFLKSTGRHLQHVPTTKHKQTLDWADLSDAMDVVNLTSMSTSTPVVSTTTQQLQQHVPKTLHSHVFNDNFGFHLKWGCGNAEMGNTNSVHPRGLTDSLFYLLKHVFKVRVFCLRILAAVCSVAQGALESAAQRYIDYKIRTALNQDNLTYLISQLHDVIFSQHAIATSEQLEERKRDAVRHLNSVIPDRLANLLSTDGLEFKRGAAKLLEILHNPHLNKHLVYNLLDLIVLELYPELDKPKETDKLV